MDINAYICKNLFYFAVEDVSTFGEAEKKCYFVPAGYSIQENSIANVQYRIRNLPEEYADMKPNLQEQLQRMQGQKDLEKTDLQTFAEKPD